MKKFKVNDNVLVKDEWNSRFYKGKIESIKGNVVRVKGKNFNLNDEHVSVSHIKIYKGLKPKKVYVLYEDNSSSRLYFKSLKKVEEYLREVFDMNAYDNFKEFCSTYHIVEEYCYCS